MKDKNDTKVKCKALLMKKVKGQKQLKFVRGLFSHVNTLLGQLHTVQQRAASSLTAEKKEQQHQRQQEAFLQWQHPSHNNKKKLG